MHIEQVASSQSWINIFEKLFFLSQWGILLDGKGYGVGLCRREAIPSLPLRPFAIPDGDVRICIEIIFRIRDRKFEFDMMKM